MYFSLIPDIEYDSKPISYPFSESDFIIAKNFFRRYKIDDDVFGYATFYNKYAVGDGERIENIADAYYGNSESQNRKQRHPGLRRLCAPGALGRIQALSRVPPGLGPWIEGPWQRTD